MSAIVDPIRLAVIIAICALFPAGYLKGCSDEKERFDAYRGQVEAQGRAQEERTKARIARDKQLVKESDDAHTNRMAAAGRTVDALVRELRAERARGSVVPPAPGAATGGPGVGANNAVVCFAGDRLREGVERSLEGFEERATALVQRGVAAIVLGETCAEWAVKLGR